MTAPPPGRFDGRRFAGQRIGLFGGSFNPAHQGHRDVALAALKRLKLDRVWWLVSPQNPLKLTAGMAPQAARMDGARRVIAGHPRMTASDIESRLGTRRTADLAAALARRHRRSRFVLLIGADNLAQMPRWHRWEWLMRNMRLAVLPRAPYSLRSLRGRAAARFARNRQIPRVLMTKNPPAWAWLPMRLNPLSSTSLRRAAKES